MRILIFGAGVLGSLYAGRLAAAGQDVALLARGTRLRQLRQHGLVLFDEAIGQETHPQVRLVEELGAEDAYDLVIVIIRAEQLADALPTLAANRRIPCFLFLHNRASGPGALFDALGPGRVLLGFPGAGGTREPTQVRYRLIPQQPTTLGEPDARISPRLRQVAKALLQAGFPVALSRNMDAWLKTHAVFVTAIAGAIYDAGGTCAAHHPVRWGPPSGARGAPGLSRSARPGRANPAAQVGCLVSLAAPHFPCHLLETLLRTTGCRANLRAARPRRPWRDA